MRTAPLILGALLILGLAGLVAADDKAGQDAIVAGVGPSTTCFSRLGNSLSSSTSWLARRQLGRTSSSHRR
jgi:hypothetical protein